MAFDVSQTLYAQYASSPIIRAIAEGFGEWIDPSARLQQFYDLIWNLDTAQGYGLDVWGRIVGVSRVLQVPADTEYIGWSEQAEAQTLGHGIWYSSATLTNNFALSDAAYRRLIFAKAALNITDASIPAINRILMALFPGYGNCYVRDNGAMSLTYVFSAPLSPVDYAIVNQSGALPKPVGVSFTVDMP